MNIRLADWRLSFMDNGQAEVVGLMVIVIILIVIGVIYLRFASIKEISSYPELRTNIEVNNLLRALVKLKIENMTMSDVLYDCYRDTGCDYLRNNIEDVLESVLKLDEDYRFTLLADDVEVIGFGNCNKGLLGSFPFVKHEVYLETRLTLCRKQL